MNTPKPKLDSYAMMELCGLKGFDKLSEPKLVYQYIGHSILSTSEDPNFYEAEKARGTALVDMDSRGHIDVEPGEVRRIATFGLAGCNAVAVSGNLADGTRRGYVQHYSPLNNQLGINMLEDAIDGFVSNGASDVRAVVMVPGNHTQDPSVKWAMTPKNDQPAKLLESVICSKINDADVQVYPYSEQGQSGDYGQGTLMVEFSTDGFTNMYAEKWTIKPQSK